MPVNVSDVVRQVVMDCLFYTRQNQEEQLKEHIDSVKKEIYSELEKIQGEHYFWKWCKDNWEIFDTYNFREACVSTQPGKSSIYGGPMLSSDKLFLDITEDKTAKIFLKTDKILKFWRSIKK